MRTLLLAILLLTGCATTEPPPVRVGVIGGFARTGLWKELARRFEASSRIKTDLVVTGNRDVVSDAFARGELDFAAMHAGEAASKLKAAHLQEWVQNEFVIIGPKTDPAHIRGLRDGAKAFAKIAQTKSRLVDYQNSGPRDLVENLWKSAGIDPNGKWILETDADSSEDALAFAAANNAYLVLGRVPKMPANLEALVEGDPQMTRRFVIVHNGSPGARSLAKFLNARETKSFIRDYANKSPEGLPRFYPIDR